MLEVANSFKHRVAVEGVLGQVRFEFRVGFSQRSGKAGPKACTHPGISTPAPPGREANSSRLLRRNSRKASAVAKCGSCGGDPAISACSDESALPLFCFSRLQPPWSGSRAPCGRGGTPTVTVGKRIASCVPLSWPEVSLCCRTGDGDAIHVKQLGPSNSLRSRGSGIVALVEVPEPIPQRCLAWTWHEQISTFLACSAAAMNPKAYIPSPCSLCSASTERLQLLLSLNLGVPGLPERIAR